MKRTTTYLSLLCFFLLYCFINQTHAQNPEVINDGRLKVEIWATQLWTNLTDDGSDPEAVVRDIQVRVPNSSTGTYYTSPAGFHAFIDGEDRHAWYNLTSGQVSVQNNPGLASDGVGYKLLDETYPSSIAPTRFEWKASEFFENDCGNDFIFESSCGLFGALDDDEREFMNNWEDGMHGDASVFDLRGTQEGEVGYVQADYKGNNRFSIMFAYRWTWVDALPDLCTSPMYQDGPVELRVEYLGVWSDNHNDGGGLGGDEDLRVRIQAKDNIDASYNALQILWESQADPEWNLHNYQTPLYSKSYTTADTDFVSFDINIEVWEEDGCGSDTTFDTGCSNADENQYQGVVSVNWRDAVPNEWNYVDLKLRNNTSTEDNYTLWIRYSWTIGAPQILAQPTPQEIQVCTGEAPPSFSVATENVTYFQWQVADVSTPICPTTANWTDIPGETCANFTPPTTTGTFIYRLLAMNRSGMGNMMDSGDRLDVVYSDCFAVTYGDCVEVAPKVFLQGPLVASLMDDDLRTSNLIPLAEPYTGLGTAPPSLNPNAMTTSGVLVNAGNDAIVDWVIVELRDAAMPAIIISSKAALLQRDGDVVDEDGVSAVKFVGVSAGMYHVAICHRNHLGVMTGAAVMLN